MPGDVTERLRELVEESSDRTVTALCEDAAQEIERLRELVERLRRTIDVGDLAGPARREGA